MVAWDTSSLFHRLNLFKIILRWIGWILWIATRFLQAFYQRIKRTMPAGICRSCYGVMQGRVLFPPDEELETTYEVNLTRRGPQLESTGGVLADIPLQQQRQPQHTSSTLESLAIRNTAAYSRKRQRNEQKILTSSALDTLSTCPQQQLQPSVLVGCSPKRYNHKENKRQNESASKRTSNDTTYSISVSSVTRSNHHLKNQHTGDILVNLENLPANKKISMTKPTCAPRGKSKREQSSTLMNLGANFMKPEHKKQTAYIGLDTKAGLMGFVSESSSQLEVSTGIKTTTSKSNTGLMGFIAEDSNSDQMLTSQKEETIESTESSLRRGSLSSLVVPSKLEEKAKQSKIMQSKKPAKSETQSAESSLLISSEKEGSRAAAKKQTDRKRVSLGQNPISALVSSSIPEKASTETESLIGTMGNDKLSKAANITAKEKADKILEQLKQKCESSFTGKRRQPTGRPTSPSTNSVLVPVLNDDSAKAEIEKNELETYQKGSCLARIQDGKLEPAVQMDFLRTSKSNGMESYESSLLSTCRSQNSLTTSKSTEPTRNEKRKAVSKPAGTTSVLASLSVPFSPLSDIEPSEDLMLSNASSAADPNQIAEDYKRKSQQGAGDCLSKVNGQNLDKNTPTRSTKPDESPIKEENDKSISQGEMPAEDFGVNNAKNMSSLLKVTSKESDANETTRNATEKESKDPTRLTAKRRCRKVLVKSNSKGSPRRTRSAKRLDNKRSPRRSAEKSRPESQLVSMSEGINILKPGDMDVETKTNQCKTGTTSNYPNSSIGDNPQRPRRQRSKPLRFSEEFLEGDCNPSNKPQIPSKKEEHDSRPQKNTSMTTRRSRTKADPIILDEESDIEGGPPSSASTIGSYSSIAYSPEKVAKELILKTERGKAQRTIAGSCQISKERQADSSNSQQFPELLALERKKSSKSISSKEQPKSKKGKICEQFKAAEDCSDDTINKSTKSRKERKKIANGLSKSLNLEEFSPLGSNPQKDIAENDSPCSSGSYGEESEAITYESWHLGKLENKLKSVLDPMDTTRKTFPKANNILYDQVEVAVNNELLTKLAPQPPSFKCLGMNEMFDNEREQRLQRRNKSRKRKRPKGQYRSCYDQLERASDNSYVRLLMGLPPVFEQVVEDKKSDHQRHALPAQKPLHVFPDMQAAMEVASKINQGEQISPESPGNGEHGAKKNRYQNVKVEKQNKADGDWTSDEISVLRLAYMRANALSPTFWEDIANLVGGGRSAACCQAKWFSLAKTPAQKATKKKKVDLKVHVPEGHDVEDDVFNSTPMRGIIDSEKEGDGNGSSQKKKTEKQHKNGLNFANFSMASPIKFDKNFQRRHLSGEVEDGDGDLEVTDFRLKPGYKTYIRDFKKKVRQGKLQKPKKNKRKKASTMVSEQYGDGAVAMRGNLSPGGTLKVKSLYEEEEDIFFNDGGSGSEEDEEMYGY